MHRHDARGMVVVLSLIGASMLGGVIAGSAAPSDVVREGTIERVAGDGITVAAAGAAPTQVKIAATTVVVGRQRVTLETIKPGDYVGVDATRGMEYAVKVENRTLFLKYQDGAATISVPPNAEVQRQTLIRPGDLRPGMHVVVRGAANPDGSITASSISVDQP